MNEGVLFQNTLSKAPGAKRLFIAGIQKPKLRQLYLTNLNSAACLVIPGGLEYRGQGLATLHSVSGYEASFAIAVTGAGTTFSLEVTKGKSLIYKISGAPTASGTVERATE